MPLTQSTIPVAWSARHAWSSDRGGHGLTVRFFRRSFELAAVPASLLVDVSADSRYVLFVNGGRIGRGPAKGLLQSYGVDTYDLAPHVRAGRNVLAAEVRWFGENTPMSEVHSGEPGFLVHCAANRDLDTPGEWRVWGDPEAILPDTTQYHGNAQTFLNHVDRVDLRRLPAGWELPRFDDGGWLRAQAIGLRVNASARWGVADIRRLVPRDIPLLKEEPRRFPFEIAEGKRGGGRFAAGSGRWAVAADVGGTLVLDAGENTTGYPVILDGNSWTWEPFHWRSFWFLQIEVLAGPEPVEITDIHFRFTTFPQQLQAEFASSDPESVRMWEVSWRTLQLCAHETYEDCPHYEQLSYVADTRLQALASLYLANETRLSRRCLGLYRDSLRPDGFIGARVPSVQPQLIPYFCLAWIMMLDDYWQWTGPRELDFVRGCLGAVDSILGAFRARLREDGFVGPMEPWNMVDRADGWQNGEPPAVVEGGSTYLTSLLVGAMYVAAGLHEQAGMAADGKRWRELAATLSDAVRTRAWNEQEGLFDEGPGRTDRRSQHSQYAAINAGAATEGQQRRILSRLMTDETLHRAHFMQSFYLARGLEKAGGYLAFHHGLLTPWRRMLAQGTSTWWEYPDPTRSDCHAWSSWIAVDFLRTVLGARPGTPGWRSIVLAPQVDGLSWARGSLMTPVGKISVQWESGDGELHYSAKTPPGVPVSVQLPGHEPRAFDGGEIELVVPLRG